MKMEKLVTMLLVGCVSFGTVTFASDTDLEARIAALEERVAALEAIIENSNGNSENDDTFTLGSGLYIAGEDIATGSYSLTITEGVGYVDVFSSYDDFVENEGSHYDALYSYLMATNEVKQDLVDLGYATQAGQYVTEVTSLNLKEGMCLNVDNITAKCVKIR